MVLSFVIKSGIVVGAVYYTRQAGVWGSTQESEQLYNDLKSQLQPHVQKLEKRLPFEMPALPEKGELRFLAKHYYNQGVKETFHFIHMLPCYAGQAAKKVKDTFNEFAASPTPSNTIAERPKK